MIKKVCVFCASSTMCDKKYFDFVQELGAKLTDAAVDVIYGGGAEGLMGQLADTVLENKGSIKGIIPKFMFENNWDHKQLQDLMIVDDMHARMQAMTCESDAFITLPGGCGTFHEFMEAITWKRLGLHTKPVILVNIDGFYDPLIQMLDDSIKAKFMGKEHGKMWNVVTNIEETMDLLKNPPIWHVNALDFANVK